MPLGDKWEEQRQQIIGLGVDSARKNYYPELRRQLAELERFRGVLNQINDALLVAEVDSGQLTDCNDTACHLLAYSRDELMLMGIYELLEPSVQAELRAAAQADGFHKIWLTTFQRAQGEPLPVEITVRRVSFDDHPYFVALARDITERLQLEAERTRLQQDLIEAQQRMIHELSTPVIPLMDRMLVMPLVGSIDALRAKDLMRALLQGVTRHRARLVILDITGVPLVDSGVAGYLDKTMQAARLKGAQVIVTGVSDAVAETIVDLGLNWAGIETLQDMQTGLITGLERLGYQLVQKKGFRQK